MGARRDHRQAEQANGVQGDVQLARFLADRDRLPEALAIAEAEYKRRPNVFVADALAWSYYKNGSVCGCPATDRQGARPADPDANILFHAGMIYAKLGDRATAQNLLYQALSLNPDFHPIFKEGRIRARSPPSAADCAPRPTDLRFLTRGRRIVCSRMVASAG